MTDIENDIIDLVNRQVKASFPQVTVAGTYVKSPSVFPFLSIEQRDSYGDSRTIDTMGAKNDVVMLEFNGYSNLINEKKRECKAIMALVDEIITGIGFTRIMLKPIPNESDGTVYRMTGRYRASVDRNKVIYRR